MAPGSALDLDLCFFFRFMANLLVNFVFQLEDEEFVDDEFVGDEDVKLFPNLICKPYMFEPELKSDDSANVSGSDCLQSLPSRLVDSLLPGNSSYAYNWHIMKLQSRLKVPKVKSPFPMPCLKSSLSPKANQNLSEKHENRTISIIQFEISKLYI